MQEAMVTAVVYADVSYRLSPASNEAPWCVKSGQEAAIRISSSLVWAPHIHFSVALFKKDGNSCTYFTRILVCS